ncbi:MAG: hypothetical protein E6R03_01435 [Hyphomicrobiaceae bacterium]|jgi:hypothetical protein|nr:MAG: hypothetical protein E6R03_01435 [Hyphomicrobiaceae bacterium]
MKKTYISRSFLVGNSGRGYVPGQVINEAEALCEEYVSKGQAYLVTEVEQAVKQPKKEKASE